MPVDEHTIEYLNKNIEDIKSELKVIKVDIESRVKYQHFTWVLGLLMTIVIGLLSVIYIQVKDTSDTIVEMQKQVSLIQYRLDSAEISQ